MKTFQIKIQLQDCKPTISRTILISGTFTFFDLHVFIQDLFGFSDYHLWNFTYGERPNDVEIVVPHDEIEPLHSITKDASKTTLEDIFWDGTIQGLRYEYDYGDNWGFDVDCQKTTEMPSKQQYPLLLKTNGGMLIEDCGGSHGLMNMLNSYRKKEPYSDFFDTFEDFEDYILPAVTEVDWESFKFSDPKKIWKKYRM